MQSAVLPVSYSLLSRASDAEAFLSMPFEPRLMHETTAFCGSGSPQMQLLGDGGPGRRVGMAARCGQVTTCELLDSVDPSAGKWARLTGVGFRPPTGCTGTTSP